MAQAKKQEVATVDHEGLTKGVAAIQAEAQERAVALRELGVEATDLVISSIQVMQGTSALVGEDKAKIGDIVNMQTEEILSSPVKLLPLKLFKTLRIYNVAEGGFKFLREEPLTTDNDKLPNEGVEDGQPVKRFHTFNYFVLLKNDLAKGEGFPCLIRFKSTGMNAGRGLATHLYKLVFFRKKPYSQFVELSIKKEKKGTNTYAVPVIDGKNGGAASEAEMKEAENWLAMLAAGKYKVDERDDATEATEAAAPVVLGAEVVGKESGEY